MKSLRQIEAALFCQHQRFARREQIKNERYPDAMSPDARLAAAPFRVNPDAFQQFFARQMFHNVANLAVSDRFDHSLLSDFPAHSVQVIIPSGANCSQAENFPSGVNAA